MGRNAIRSGVVVVHRGSGCVELEADEAADCSLEPEGPRVDDVDARIGAIAQIVLCAIRIDPTDIERLQRTIGSRLVRVRAVAASPLRQGPLIIFVVTIEGASMFRSIFVSRIAS
jgi:hypothetical protein